MEISCYIDEVCNAHSAYMSVVFRLATDDSDDILQHDLSFS